MKWLELVKTLFQTKHLNVQVTLDANPNDVELSEVHFGEQLGELPDDCSDLLDDKHAVIYFRSKLTGDALTKIKSYHWNHLITDIENLSDEQLNQDVTLFDSDTGEAYPIDSVKYTPVGHPYLAY